MDLEVGPRYEAFRQEVRTFLERHRDVAPTAAVGGMRDGRVLDWQKTLVEHGYRLDRLRAFDLFPMTHHIECVALVVPTALGS